MFQKITTLSVKIKVLIKKANNWCLLKNLAFYYVSESKRKGYINEKKRC